VPYVRLVSELRHGSEKLVAAAATQSGFYFCSCLVVVQISTPGPGAHFSKCAGLIQNILQNNHFYSCENPKKMQSV